MTLTLSFDPVIAQLGPFQLGWHGIFTSIAVLVAVWLAGRLALRRGIPTEVVFAIAGWGVAGGLIGARLFHIADNLLYCQQNPSERPGRAHRWQQRYT
jgi:phosphatidylglycerol:prolipoprotein diacylglycerol transferase